MEKWVYADFKNLAFVLLSVIVVYLTVITLTRIFGKRSFSKMSSFDFACTIAIGSVISSTLLYKSIPLYRGLFALFILFALQALTAFLRRYAFVKKAIDNNPILLMDSNGIKKENMLKAKVTESEIRAKLREANVINLTEVKAVVLENTGDISVLHCTDKQKSIDNWIVKDVNNK